MSTPSWTSPNDTGKPDWLKNDQPTDLEANNTKSSSSWTEVPPPPPSTSTAGQSVSNSGSDEKAGGKSSVGCCCENFASLISLLFVGIFAASAYFHDRDSNIAILWVVFFSVHAAIAFFSVVTRRCCRGWFEKAVSGVAFSGMVWGIVMVVLTALEYQKTEGGGPKEGGLNDKLTEKEEKLVPVIGAALGVVSGFFHILLYSCCARK
jgi:uncharacterized membrane protein (UPF0136 family)